MYVYISTRHYLSRNPYVRLRISRSISTLVPYFFLSRIYFKCIYKQKFQLSSRKSNTKTNLKVYFAAGISKNTSELPKMQQRLSIFSIYCFEKQWRTKNKQNKSKKRRNFRSNAAAAVALIKHPLVLSFYRKDVRRTHKNLQMIRCTRVFLGKKAERFCLCICIPCMHEAMLICARKNGKHVLLNLYFIHVQTHIYVLRITHNSNSCAAQPLCLDVNYSVHR